MPGLEGAERKDYDERTAAVASGLQMPDIDPVGTAESRALQTGTTS